MELNGSLVIEHLHCRGWKIKVVSQWDFLQARFAALAFVSKTGASWRAATDQPLWADMADDARYRAIDAANDYIDHAELSARAA